MQENELIQNLKEGDERAFEIIYDRYATFIYRVVLKICNHQHDAEDLTQEVFTEVVRAVKGFNLSCSLQTWLYRIATNKALDALRKKNTGKRKGMHVSTDEVEVLEKLKNNATPDKELERKQHYTLLLKAIARLPVRQQTAFTLCQLEDLSYKEAAEVMEVSVATIEGLVHRAKKELREQLMVIYSELK